MNVKEFRFLFKLCEDFQNEQFLTPSEFIEQYENLDENDIYYFLDLQRHVKILDEVVEKFIKFYKIVIRMNNVRMKVLFYIFLLLLDDQNLECIKEIFFYVYKISYLKNIPLFLLIKDNQIDIAHISCKYFDNEYVMNNIVNPMLDNQENFISIIENTEQEVQKQYKKEVTIPIETNLINPIKKYPETPANTPEEIFVFKSTKIPKTTYCADINVKIKLEREYLNNQEKAIHLLETSKGLTCSLKPQKILPIESLKPPPRPKRIFVPKNVPIKNNYTTIMRQAMLYAKKKEKCIKEINDIIKGGVDTKLTKVLEENNSKVELERKIEKIEKNRLKSLLSHEEAALAKIKNIELNKLQAAELKLKKEEFRKKLEQWKAEEQEKNKQTADKIIETRGNVKEIEKKILEEKQCNARLLQFESKQLQEKAAKEKEKDMARKIHIIQEMKAINQLTTPTSKEFDKNETPNLGLLCEMSIAELEQRLQLMKKKMDEELEKKRRCIHEEKIKKEQLVNEAKAFIDQNKIFKRTKHKKEPIECKETPDIVELKIKLAEARATRKNMENCKCPICPGKIN